MQRRVLLRRGLVDGDAVFVHCWLILSDRKLQHGHMPARVVLRFARTGQLHAESDRLVLRHDKSHNICAVHCGVILPDAGSECSDWHL